MNLLTLRLPRRRGTLVAFAVFAAVICKPALGQGDPTDRLLGIITEHDAAGGQRVVGFLPGAPIAGRLQIGDVILSGFVKGAGRTISANQVEGLTNIRAELESGQNVVLTLLRPTDSLVRARNYVQMNLELSREDLRRSPPEVPDDEIRFGIRREGDEPSVEAPESPYPDMGTENGGYGAVGEAATDYHYEGLSDEGVVDNGPTPWTPQPPSAPIEKGHRRFPWPPPRASAREVIPRELFLLSDGGQTLLRNVDRLLTSALDENEYFDSSYYAVDANDDDADDGFALVTRIERFEDDGRSKQGTARWSLALDKIKDFSILGYLKALFSADPGKYRVIVFIVTPHAFGHSDSTVTAEEATNWLTGGLDRLPPSIGNLEFSQDHKCTALVYEFNRASKEADPEQVVPGLPGRVHLIKSGVWGVLQP